MIQFLFCMWQEDSTAAKIYPLDVVAGRDDEIKPENRIGLCRISYSWMSEDEFLADIMESDNYGRKTNHSIYPYRMKSIP